MCPKCGTLFVVQVLPTRGRAAPATARPVAVIEEEEVETTPAGAEAEFVPLEEAEAADDAKVVTDDAEVEEEIATEDEAFLEEAEEGDDDVADLIDGDLEDDEET